MKYVKFWILEELEPFLEPQKILLTILSEFLFLFVWSFWLAWQHTH